MVNVDLGLVAAAIRRGGGAPPAPSVLDFAAGSYAWGGPPSGSLPAGWSFARASAGMARTAAGAWTAFSSGQARITNAGLLYEATATNKCANYNAAPAALVSMANATTFNAAAPAGLTAIDTTGLTLFGIVDDTTAMSAVTALAGLVGGGTLNGRAIKIDNTSGSAPSTIEISGATGSTSGHVPSAYVRGSGQMRIRLTGNSGGAYASMNAAYTRTSAGVLTPGGSSDAWRIQVQTGAVCYVILNQLETAAMTSPIVVAGSSATRAADAASVTLPAGDPTDVITVTWSGGPTVFTRADLAVTDVLNLSVDGGAPWIGAVIEQITLEAA